MVSVEEKGQESGRYTHPSINHAEDEDANECSLAELATEHKSLGSSSKAGQLTHRRCFSSEHLCELDTDDDDDGMLAMHRLVLLERSSVSHDR